MLTKTEIDSVKSKVTSQFNSLVKKLEIQDNFKLIFSGIVGSTLYDTCTSDSDIDVKGVFIPPKKYFLGFLHRIEQLEDKEDDTSFYNIKKFLITILDCNPTYIEMFFIPENYQLTKSDDWNKILECRDLIISKKARHSFMGYAISQLKRIKVSRNYLLNPPKRKPERKDFGLPNDIKLITSDQIGAFNSLIVKFLDEVKEFHELRNSLEEMNETFSFRNIIQRVEFNVDEVKKFLPQVNKNIIHALSAEKQYQKSLNDWNKYLQWKNNRNKKRAILEEKYGYDTKHALHLVRLIHEGKELLETGKITLPRPESEFLKDILYGKWSFEYLLEYIDNFDKDYEELYKSSTLRYEPNRVEIENLMVNLVEKHLK